MCSLVERNQLVQRVFGRKKRKGGEKKGKKREALGTRRAHLPSTHDGGCAHDLHPHRKKEKEKKKERREKADRSWRHFRHYSAAWCGGRYFVFFSKGKKRKGGRMEKRNPEEGLPN